MERAELSRRSVLSVIPAAALLTVAQALRVRAAGRDGPAAVADHTTLLRNTVTMFAGTAETNARPETGPRIASVLKTARARLAAMDGVGQGELFEGVPLGTSDVNLSPSFQYLYEIALATRLPGTGGPPHEDEVVRRRVVDGLVRLHDTYFGDPSQGYHGNWFHWEIGIPAYVTRTFVLLGDVLAAYRPALAAAYVDSMDAYLRDGEDGDVDLDSRFHTGANLADITTNRMLLGAVLGDDARVRRPSPTS